MPLALVRKACFGAAALAVAAWSLAVAMPAWAQQWPARPVKIIAVFPPGGSVDQVSRILAQQLTTQTGQQFIVENRGGAAGSIGANAIAKSDPDGYTFGVVFDTHGVNPSLIPNIPFDTLRDFQPLVLIGTGAMAIATHVDQPYKNFRELLATAKNKPGFITYGSIGTGSLGHLAMAQIGNEQKIQWTHIPYRGGGPLMADATAGHVPVAIGSVFLINPHVKSGRLKVLGVTSLKADPQMPGVEPISTQGVPGFDASAWWGVYGPAKIPQPIVARMVEEITKAIKAPDVAAKLTAQGINIIAGGPDALDKFQRNEITRWAKVVKANDIKAGD
jgi:tripartite-type tricarboxylate transporter receptor subunit TctC